MSNNPAPDVISVRIKDACRMTGIGRSKFYELIAAGEVEIVKIGTMTLVPTDSLRKLIERGRQCDEKRACIPLGSHRRYGCCRNTLGKRDSS